MPRLSEALKPCPFCNGEAEIRIKATTLVSCKKCGASTFQALQDNNSAIVAWNRRPSPVGEPVAFMIDDVHFVHINRTARNAAELYGWTPLYTHTTPQPCQNCDELQQDIRNQTSNHRERESKLEAEIARLTKERDALSDRPTRDMWETYRDAYEEQKFTIAQQAEDTLRQKEALTVKAEQLELTNRQITADEKIQRRLEYANQKLTEQLAAAEKVIELANDTLSMPCSFWNKTQHEKVKEALSAIKEWKK